MGFYKSIFNNKLIIAGRSKGAKPSFLLPPSAANAKQGYQIYESIDLICEGEVEGLVGQHGKTLIGTRAQKAFNQEHLTVGSSSSAGDLPIDQGIYYNDTPLRDSSNNSTHSKYDIEFKSGRILQGKCNVVKTPTKLTKVSGPIKGPYSMSGASNGARTGSGSRDVRTEGTSARDFVNWQRYVPKERAEKPYRYTNYDKDIDLVDIGLQIDGLSDTVSKSSKSENKAGRSKMGTPIAISIRFRVIVGKATKNGTVTTQNAIFTVRPGKGKTVGNGNGRVTLKGIITSPYTFTLENITLPVLGETDLYNFVEISKLDHETISNLVARDGGVNSITEKYNDTYYYPGSCYIATIIDSQYYQNIPARTYRIKGKKIKIPSNYNPTDADGTDRRFSSDGTTSGNVIYAASPGLQIGQWDGTFKYAWSDNPAWIYYDLLTNRRYGLGNYLRDIDIIDKWTLYEIGMYCDAVTMHDGSKTTNQMGGAGKFIGLDDGFGGLEPRFSCNILIKDQTDAFDAIQNLARSFRAMTYFNNSCVSIRVDRPYFFEDFNNTSTTAPKENKFPPHLIFNNLNVKDGMFSYADVDRQTKLSAVEVSFIDKRNNFTAQTEYVEDPEAIKTVGLNFKQIEGIGVTSKAQAHRLGKYILFESQNTTETVSFGAGFEALLMQPGDIIKIDDEMRNFTRNYGTVLGASGTTNYSNPDGTTSNIGQGPSAIIVEPAIGSDLTDYVTGGNIHIYNPIGKSGIEDFYNNPSSDNSLYREIHNPQVISLKIKDTNPGETNVSYEIIDSGVAIFITGADTPGSTSSQWYSEKDANIKHGSIYNIDASGRDPRYYRVLNVSEDKDAGFNVSATIHHTGKFKFVEENISFDLDGSSFQPNLSVTEVQRPDLPSNVTTSFSNGVGSTKNLNVSIFDPSNAAKSPDKYIVILEEPNSNTIVSEHFRSNSNPTNIVLSGDSKIDQVGDYSISVFSQNITPTVARTTSAFLVEFTTSLSTFGFTVNQDAFTEYSNIFIDTIFSSTFDNSAETGHAENSFFENDPLINATVNLEYEDIFGNAGPSVQADVNEQIINIYDTQDNLKSGNFKQLTTEGSFEILNSQIDEMFGYTGEGKYRIPPSLNIEVNSFEILGAYGANLQVNFDATFSEAPALFIQQKATGLFTDVYKPEGRISTENTRFTVRPNSDAINNGDYTYLASQTGRYVVDGKNIEIDFVSKNDNTGYQPVLFSQAFAAVPTIIIQLQQPHIQASPHDTSQTCVTGVSHTGFHFAAFQENNVAAGSTGKYAYIAVDKSAFNNTYDTDLPVNVINYAGSENENFSFQSDSILDQFNKSNPSTTNNTFTHDQYAVFCQRSGEDDNLKENYFVVTETGDQNKLHQQMLASGLDIGIRANQTNGSDNHIFVTGSGLNVGTGDFTMEAWVKFDPGLDGKQYLLESHKNGTGIAWFQSGDGKNYINLNGVDHLAITGNGGVSLNDGNLHNLQVQVTRQLYSEGLIDGDNQHVNQDVTQHSTGFTIQGVGSGMPQNTGDFDGTYTGDGNLYQNTVSSGLRVRTTGSNNTWILVDDDPSIDYINTPIAWSGGENIVHPHLVTPYGAASTSWSGGAFYTGFTMDPGIGSGMVNNTGSFDGTYTGGTNLYQHTTTSGLRLKQTGSNNTWVFCDDDPNNTYFTGFEIDGIGSGMVDNPNSFDGTYTGGADLFINTSNFGLRVKKSGSNNTWIFVDEDLANTYSHNRIAWSGGENVNFPGNVTAWTGGATIQDGTITDSTSPLNRFSGLLSHNRIAWSGGQNENYPWEVTAWTGGETILNGTITNSTSPLDLFTSLLASSHPGSNAPTFDNFLLETFDAETGFKILGNSELNGEALTSGHIIDYIALLSGRTSSVSHYTFPSTFQSAFVDSTSAKFILDVNASQVNRPQPALEDISTDNTSTVSLVGDVERSQSIINRSLTSNFNFLQVGVTGEL